jgi:hypothetical protein
MSFQCQMKLRLCALLVTYYLTTLLSARIIASDISSPLSTILAGAATNKDRLVQLARLDLVSVC